jgi:hypothetical protein
MRQVLLLHVSQHSASLLVELSGCRREHVLVTLALPEPALASPWAFAAGALLGVAAHFANVLPDLDDDRATGVRGLPQSLAALWEQLTTALAEEAP